MPLDFYQIKLLKTTQVIQLCTFEGQNGFANSSYLYCISMSPLILIPECLIMLFPNFPFSQSFRLIFYFSLYYQEFYGMQWIAVQVLQLYFVLVRDNKCSSQIWVTLCIGELWMQWILNSKTLYKCIQRYWLGYNVGVKWDKYIFDILCILGIIFWWNCNNSGWKIENLVCY